MKKLETNVSALADHTRLRLHPKPDNPLHSKPCEGFIMRGYFYLDPPVGKPENGPDYYVGDVLTYCEGWEVVS